jgi:hypothetical protein
VDIKSLSPNQIDIKIVSRMKHSIKIKSYSEGLLTLIPSTYLPLSIIYT